MLHIVTEENAVMAGVKTPAELWPSTADQITTGMAARNLIILLKGIYYLCLCYCYGENAMNFMSTVAVIIEGYLEDWFVLTLA